MSTTLNVLGYCRSTVGGYDVWVPGEPAPALLQLRDVANTSINRMNYLAVHDCLLHVRAAIDAPEQLELRIGCYAVHGQLVGSIPVRQAHCRDMCDRIATLVRECADRTRVHFRYDPDLTAPRAVVGHRRPPKQQQQ